MKNIADSTTTIHETPDPSYLIERINLAAEKYLYMTQIFDAIVSNEQSNGSLPKLIECLDKIISHGGLPKDSGINGLQIEEFNELRDKAIGALIDPSY